MLAVRIDQYRGQGSHLLVFGYSHQNRTLKIEPTSEPGCRLVFCRGKNLHLPFFYLRLLLLLSLSLDLSLATNEQIEPMIWGSACRS
ncbi:hypothetical protein BRADI_3g48085v3 [Brachypodium distachyon]|uniref:Uncharacterized protein n=1 Tax=Brachypodium distachyon TaxID=15368 RepID=A0A0Q3I2Z9_BRADI|nr:hypothetical protein BRADI_3g48085v3 [Brachypodium distachyon]